jgi:uncharacterized Zn finger protein
MALGRRRKSRYDRGFSDSWDGDFWHYRPKPAREVQGGIRAQSRSGSFSGTWWGKRWIETLESFDLGARLSRGKAYARKGQVSRLDIVKGEVRASVQGSRRTPYAVRITLTPWKPGQWSALRGALRDQPILLARLLAGEMPDGITAVLEQIGVSLFPARQNDFTSDCSCPDWSNPCKHIAAVHYLLAEALDGDPFLLFRLRGMDRDDVLDGLASAPVASEPGQQGVATGASENAGGSVGRTRKSTGGKTAAAGKTGAAGKTAAAGKTGAAGKTARGGKASPTSKTVVVTQTAAALRDAPTAGEDLPVDTEAFWSAAILPEPAPFPSPPEIDAALPRRLGPLPFWRSGQAFLEVMERMYNGASEVALSCVMEDEALDENDE